MADIFRLIPWNHLLNYLFKEEFENDDTRCQSIKPTIC